MRYRTIRVAEDVYEELSKMVTERGLTVSEAIRELLNCCSSSPSQSRNEQLSGSGSWVKLSLTPM
ncbi:ribbon-helix-helix domain-containing protein [Caldivirga maquilingensis]|uniref:ribbon-helix-helix domain-containing protein n=1 Tax=Caldivirga maquilingensis TaxID=76887 RepID=UPI000B010E7A|nr:ribbon-helix-helix protein, CopG family [Caldivirga maquilingensis]